jgi:hypothetical protein
MTDHRSQLLRHFIDRLRGRIDNWQPEFAVALAVLNGLGKV